ncbi:spore photoproduct lyase [Desulforamulus ruminis]|uniref:Spore photoproduct lyase n=1 Tax=Desulforamulus ruminis (strain ATCC 23193 / DSM 2154 / NCIMB 8452 / DL) TaxID=696281 RepID=F6DKB7_DESRL|nr:spore photoproduct lyase [Desulforamulus ruminis]AEG61534.1 spore photoproduct lyase [Desulforamulus ruminis DSM 2154]
MANKTLTPSSARNLFIPKRVFIEPAALEYPLGRQLQEHFQSEGIPITITPSHNRVSGIPSKTPQEAFLESKRTLVIGVRRGKEFQTCKPSAHYQLPLVTSCPGKCEYCYLLTNLGRKPYIRIYVNLEEILDRAQAYIQEHLPRETLFEGAATSDPIPVERYTGALKKAIEFFGRQEHARFRFVTKFTDVVSLLDARHNGRTRFRFSLNAQPVIERFEHGTPSMGERVAAAGKAARAGYPLGFLVAPIVLYEGWQEGYQELFAQLQQVLNPSSQKDLTFELITHRFTQRAKNNILEVFPGTQLDLNEQARQFKYGQFGYGKYVYPKEKMAQIKEVMEGLVHQYFPSAKVAYLV